MALRLFDLPLRDVTRDAGDRFFCPGSIVRIELDPTSAADLRDEPADRRVFFIQCGLRTDRRLRPSDGAVGERRPVGSGEIEIVARYGRRDVLLSGYLEGEYVIADQAAVVEARVGSGRIILFGFPPQHRGQTLATFRLLFNAILTTPRGR